MLNSSGNELSEPLLRCQARACLGFAWPGRRLRRAVGSQRRIRRGWDERLERKWHWSQRFERQRQWSQRLEWQRQWSRRLERRERKCRSQLRGRVRRWPLSLRAAGRQQRLHATV